MLTYVNIMALKDSSLVRVDCSVVCGFRSLKVHPRQSDSDVIAELVRYFLESGLGGVRDDYRLVRESSGELGFELCDV